MRRIPFVQYGRRVFVNKGSSQNLAGRTGEHAWQAAKYLETAPEMAAKITAAATVDEAHTLSHTEGIDKHRQDWDEAKYDILVSVPAPSVVGGAVVALGCVAQRVGLSSAPCGCVQVGLLRAKFSQHQVIPTPSRFLGCISPIFSPFFLVFCAFSPPRQDGSNEPQAGIQGQETAGTGVQTEGKTVSPV